MGIFKSSPTRPAWSVTSGPVRAPGGVHRGPGLQEARRSRGAVPPSQHPWEAALPAEPSIPVAPASLAGSLAQCRLPSASPRWFSPRPAVTCSLDFCCKQLCQRVPSLGPRAQSRMGGQHSGGWADGCLSSLPSVSSSFWVAVTASLADPDGHTSSVRWSLPRTTVLPGRPTISAGSRPPTHMEVAKERDSWGCPAPLSRTVGQGSLPPLLPHVWGAYLGLCLCTGGRTFFLSEMLSSPRGN